jgi:hypothetical protein
MEINGKRVVDATKPLRISISREDAAKGRTKDPAKCAAARAILRVIPTAKGARVHLGRTYIETDKEWMRYITPASLKTEIVSFDRGGGAEYTEGDYTLYAPSKANRIGARPNRPLGPAASRNAASARNKRKKIARKIHQIEGVRAHGANK